MKKFTKLALATSVALSANAMAMQAMDDASLSATTGQDGINIGIGISKVTIDKLYVHDNDGLDTSKTINVVKRNPTTGQLVYKTEQVDTGETDADNNPIFKDVKVLDYETKSLGGTGKAGSIFIQGNGIANHVNENHGVVITANPTALLNSHNLLDLQIDSDAGTAETGGAFLNIAAQVSGLTINIGQVGVTGSGAEIDDYIDGLATADSIRRGGTDSNSNKILSGLQIITGTMDANIQVGAAPQGAMIKLATSMKGGLEIKDLGILDNSTIARDDNNNVITGAGARAAGEIYIDSIKVADAGSKDLTINSDIMVFNNDAATGEPNNAHLRIISNSGATDQYIRGIHLGSKDAGSIGDMEIQGLTTYFGSPLAGGYKEGAIITISGR